MPWTIDPEVTKFFAENRWLDADILNRIFGGTSSQSWGAYPYSLRNKFSHLDINWNPHDANAIGIDPRTDFTNPFRLGADLNLPEDEWVVGDGFVADKDVDQTSVRNVMSGVVDALAFGLVPESGVSAAANSAALQAAVDHAVAQTGTNQMCEVFIGRPPGYGDEDYVSFIVNGKVSLPNRVQISASPGVLLSNQSSTQPIFEIDASASGWVVALKNLSFGTALFPIHILGEPGTVSIDDCFFRGGNTTNACIKIASGCGITSIRRCYFYNSPNAIEDFGGEATLVSRSYFRYDSPNQEVLAVSTGGTALQVVDCHFRFRNMPEGLTAVNLGSEGVAFNNDVVIANSSRMWAFGASSQCVLYANSVRVVAEGNPTDTGNRTAYYMIGPDSIAVANKAVAASGLQGGMSHGIRSNGGNCRIIGNTVGGQVETPYQVTNPPVVGADILRDNRVRTNIAMTSLGFATVESPTSDIIKATLDGFLGPIHIDGTVPKSRAVGVVEQGTNQVTWSPFGHGLTGTENNAEGIEVRDVVGMDWGLIAVGSFLRKGFQPDEPTVGDIVAYIARWNGSAWVPVGVGELIQGRPSDNGVNAPVHAAVRIGERAFVGGEFTDTAVVPVFTGTKGPLAYIEDGKVLTFTADWPVEGPGNGGGSAKVLAMTSYRGDLVFVGAFGSFNENATICASVGVYEIGSTIDRKCQGLGGSNSSTFRAGPSGPSGDANNLEVRCVSAEGERVVIGGTFWSILNNNTGYDYGTGNLPYLLAIYSPSQIDNWIPVCFGTFLQDSADTTSTLSVGDVSVDAVEMDGGLILAGGDFRVYKWRASVLEPAATTATKVELTYESQYLIAFVDGPVFDGSFQILGSAKADSGDPATRWPTTAMRPVALGSIVPGPVKSISKVSTNDRRFPSGFQYLIAGVGFVGVLGFQDGDVTKPVFRRVPGPMPLESGSGTYKVAKQIGNRVVIGGQFNEAGLTAGGRDTTNESAYGKNTNIVDEGMGTIPPGEEGGVGSFGT